jgi:hypothetical protein
MHAFSENEAGSEEYLPALHDTHACTETAPSSTENVPRSQGMQVVSDVAEMVVE